MKRFTHYVHCTKNFDRGRKGEGFGSLPLLEDPGLFLIKCRLAAWLLALASPSQQSACQTKCGQGRPCHLFSLFVFFKVERELLSLWWGGHEYSNTLLKYLVNFSAIQYLMFHSIVHYHYQVVENRSLCTTSSLSFCIQTKIFIYILNWTTIFILVYYYCSDYLLANNVYHGTVKGVHK